MQANTAHRLAIGGSVIGQGNLRGAAEKSHQCQEMLACPEHRLIFAHLFACQTRVDERACNPGK